MPMRQYCEEALPSRITNRHALTFRPFQNGSLNATDVRSDAVWRGSDWAFHRLPMRRCRLAGIGY